MSRDVEVGVEAALGNVENVAVVGFGLRFNGVDGASYYVYRQVRSKTHSCSLMSHRGNLCACVHSGCRQAETAAHIDTH